MKSHLFFTDKLSAGPDIFPDSIIYIMIRDPAKAGHRRGKGNAMPYLRNAGLLIKLIPSVSLGARIATRLAKGESSARRSEIGLQLGYALYRDGALCNGLLHRGRILPLKSIMAIPRVVQLIPEPGKEDASTEAIHASLIYARTNTRSKLSLPRVTPRGLWISLGLLIQPAKLNATLQNLEAKYNPHEAIKGAELFNLQARVEGLILQLAERLTENMKLQEEVESGKKVVDFMQKITQMIVRGVPDDEFIHSLCGILFKVAGLRRCIAFLHDPVREALVAEEQAELDKPWASENPEHTAEIEAFTSREGRASLVIPLTPEGQKEMAREMIGRAARLALNPLSPPGSTVARRILSGLPRLIGGKMVKPTSSLLSADEQAVWDRLELELAYSLLNVEAISRGWNRYYSGEGDQLELEFSKDIMVGGKVRRVVLKRERVTDIEWQEFGIDEGLQRELLAGRHPEVLQRILDLWTIRPFHSTKEAPAAWLRSPVEIDGAMCCLGLAEWKEIFAEAESILTRVFKLGHTLVVNDTSNPEFPISKILVRMWGSRTFIAAPIKIFALAPDEERGGYKMEERVIGVFGMDHDQHPRTITPEVKRRVDLLVHIASIGFTLRSYIRALETALGKHLGPRVMHEIVTKLLIGRPTELAPQPAVCSVMFTDIVGFTGVTQRLKTLGANYLADFLTDYRDWLDGFIFDHEGVLDKYVGDAHVAAWGTPVARHKDDAARALQAAIAMQREADRFIKVTRWGRIFQTIGLPPLKIRVGIDTGEVMAGVLASKHKHEYTVVGDAVNRANRFEGAAGPSGILISETTFGQLGMGFIERYVRETNETIRSWLGEDLGPAVKMDWRDFTADDIFTRKKVQIKIGGQMEDAWVYQVEWDRKKLKETIFAQFYRPSP